MLTLQFALLLFFLTTIQVSGKVPFQQNFIHGHVTDSSGRALSGVSVLVRGTKRGAATNPTGEYKIQANRGESLEFSYVGYQTQTITEEIMRRLMSHLYLLLLH